MATRAPQVIPFNKQAANLAPLLAQTIAPAYVRLRLLSLVSGAYSLAGHLAQNRLYGLPVKEGEVEGHVYSRGDVKQISSI